tara:strand:+ start:835 stop:1266 length:432 start_codon:yes stop_codon:yes gene_type:complete
MFSCCSSIILTQKEFKEQATSVAKRVIKMPPVLGDWSVELSLKHGILLLRGAIVMNSKLIIVCGTHGKRLGCAVCSHLVQAQDKIVGFIENNDDPNDLQAWCEQCEVMYLKEKGLTVEFEKFHELQIICDLCYQTLKSKHSVT